MNRLVIFIISQFYFKSIKSEYVDYFVFYAECTFLNFKCNSRLPH